MGATETDDSNYCQFHSHFSTVANCFGFLAVRNSALVTNGDQSSGQDAVSWFPRSSLLFSHCQGPFGNYQSPLYGSGPLNNITKPMWVTHLDAYATCKSSAPSSSSSSPSSSPASWTWQPLSNHLGTCFSYFSWLWRLTICRPGLQSWAQPQRQLCPLAEVLSHRFLGSPGGNKIQAFH